MQQHYNNFQVQYEFGLKLKKHNDYYNLGKVTKWL